MQNQNKINQPHYVNTALNEWYKGLPHGARPELAKILETKNDQAITDIFLGRSELPLEMALKLLILTEDLFEITEIYPEVTHTLDILVQKGINKEIEKFKKVNNLSKRA